VPTRLARIADSAKNEYRLAVAPWLNKNGFEQNPDLAVPADHVRQIASRCCWHV
jgi:hypothetical protein